MKKLFLLIVVVIAISIYYITSKKQEYIEIGFLGGLSGKYSNLGHSLLNGMNLAFEEENFMVNDKKIVVLTKDDKQKENYAKLAILEFKKRDIKLILGSGTSSMTKAALDSFTPEYKPILISASASSNDFSKIDDNFIRTQVSQSQESFTKLSKYLVKNSIKNIYAIYDSKNSSYSIPYANNFQNSFIKFGGKSFVSMKEISNDFNYLINDIKSKSVDAIVVIGNTLDTAKLVQFLRINKINSLIIGSSWAKSSVLLEDGGKYVEDMIFLTSYNDRSQKKEYLDFVENYKKRFSIAPSIFASQAYETAKIIMEVLKTDSNLLNFKTNALKIKKFKGLQGDIEFDEYGDIKRDYYLMTIKNGSYEVVKD